MSSQQDQDFIRNEVRKRYADVAGKGGSCCASSCSCSESAIEAIGDSTRLGYSKEDLASVPEGSNLGLGCGNPQAIAAMKPGEIVVDLGSGAGFDCFLAARQVEKTGRVIGVDMTPEMVSKARENGRKGGYENVEFRLGEIEHLPIADNSADVIISNCVINLSPDKRQVFKEAFRVLKPGGRLAVSDVVATRSLSDQVRSNLAAYCGCIGGAAQVSEVNAMLEEAGFATVKIQLNEASREFIKDWFPGSGMENEVVSAIIEAKKSDSAARG
jgi:SAM-dependent methyltransferase